MSILVKCDRKCMPSEETLAGNATHYLDCYIWDFTGLRKEHEGTRRMVGPAQFRGVTTIGQRRAAAPSRPRDRVLYALGRIATVGSVLGIIVLLGALLGAWIGWWN